MTVRDPDTPKLRAPAWSGPPRVGARTRDWLAIAGPAGLAAVLCLIQITSRSLGFDEAATATIAAQHGSALGSAIAHDGGNMSGYYLLMHVLIGVLGNGELVLRLPSAAATVATVALTGATALRLFGRRAAVAAGLLTAVSLPLVFWAQSARGYALMVAFVCGAFLVFIPLARPDDGGRRPLWIAYVVLMTLAIYSSFVAVLVIPAQLLVLLPAGRRARIKPFAAALGGTGVLCIPLLVLAARRGSGQLFWVPRPTHKFEIQVLQSLTSTGQGPSIHPTATTNVAMLLTLVLLAAVGGQAIRAWRSGAPQWGVAMAGAWLVVPVAITFVYSLLAQPLFLPRNLLMSVPAASVLLGAGYEQVARVRPRGAQLAPAALLILIALRALQLVPSYGVSPEPWRQATAYVLAHARRGDCLAFYPEDGRMAFQYYIGTGSQTSRAPRSILPVARWGTVRPFVEEYDALSGAKLRARKAGCARLWFVSSHEGQPDGPMVSLAHRARFLQLRAELERAFGRGQIKQFGYASAVHVELLTAAASRRGT